MNIIKIDNFILKYDNTMDCICDPKRKKVIFTNDDYIVLYLTVIIKDNEITMYPDGNWGIYITNTKENEYLIKLQ